MQLWKLLKRSYTPQHGRSACLKTLLKTFWSSGDDAVGNDLVISVFPTIFEFLARQAACCIRSTFSQHHQTYSTNMTDVLTFSTFSSSFKRPSPLLFPTNISFITPDHQLTATQADHISLTMSVAVAAAIRADPSLGHHPSSMSSMTIHNSNDKMMQANHSTTTTPRISDTSIIHLYNVPISSESSFCRTSCLLPFA